MVFSILAVFSISYAIVFFMLAPFVLVGIVFTILSYVRLYYLRLPLRPTALFTAAGFGVVAIQSGSAILPVDIKEQSFEDSEFPLIRIVEVEHYVLPSGLERHVLYSEQGQNVLSRNVLRLYPTENYGQTSFAKMITSHYLNGVRFCLNTTGNSSGVNEVNNSILVAAYTHSSRFPENVKLSDFDFLGNHRDQYASPLFSIQKLGLMGSFYKTNLSITANPDCISLVNYDGSASNQVILVSGSSKFLSKNSLILKSSGGSDLQPSVKALKSPPALFDSIHGIIRKPKLPC